MSTNHPPADWLQALPRDRLLVDLSLWSSDLANMARDIERTEPLVDIYHVDVGDGRFTPTFLMFPDQVARIRTLTTKPIHVHVMVERDILLSQVQQFLDAGADLISVHEENGAAVGEALDLIARTGRAGGLVLRLETPVERIKPWLDRIFMVTLLGTAIGVKGVGLDETACPRLIEARRLIRDAGRAEAIRLAADGGIRHNTVPLLRAAGAEAVVPGSLVFGDPDLAGRIAWIRGLPMPDPLP